MNLQSFTGGQAARKGWQTNFFPKVLYEEKKKYRIQNNRYEFRRDCDVADFRYGGLL